MSTRSLLFLLLPLVAAAQNVSFEGTVVNKHDSQPLAGVHVQLISVSNIGGADVYGAVSDNAGRFSMASVLPGGYFLFSRRPGFVDVPSAAQLTGVGSMVLKAGQNLTGFKIEMTPSAVVSGRVLDQYGDPMPHVQIRIHSAVDSSPPFSVAFGNGQTNDRGEFRLSGRPGRYYVEAIANRGMAALYRGQPEIRTDGTTPVVYGATYFPEATSKDRATAVEAKSGAETNGIDIHMAREQNLTISGQVVGMPAERYRAVVSLIAKNNNGPGSGSSSSSVGGDGRFTFSGIQSRTYSLFAQWTDGKTSLQSQVQQVQMADANVSGTVLSLGPAGEVHGTLQITGGVAGFKPGAAKLTVAMHALDFPVYNMQTDPVAVDKDGAFHLSPIAPAAYEVKVSPLPDNAYIKALLLDGVPAVQDTGDRVDFSSAAHSSTVKIIISLNGAEVSGIIHDKDGTVVPGFVSVILSRSDQPKNQKSENVKPNGSYLFHGIRPGKYRLVAVDRTKAPRVKDEDPAAKGIEIEVKEGDRIIRDLTPLGEVDPKEAPSANHQ